MNQALEWRDLSLVFVLFVIGAFFAVAAPQFLTARNLSMLIIEFSITSVLALGMLLVLLPGHVDLSAGSGVGLVGGIAAVLIMRSHFPAPLALAVGLLAALILWRAMGTVIVSQGIPAFIVTLGGLLVFKGLFWLIIRNTTVPVSPGGAQNLFSVLTTYYVPPRASLGLATALSLGLGCASFQADREQRRRGYASEDAELRFLTWLVSSQAIFVVTLLCAKFRGLPLPALLLGTLAVLIHVILRHTRFGRYLYAIGGNEEAAVLSGIPVRRVVVRAFTWMGGVVALTGFLQTAYSGASTTTIGELMELDAVAACVIGGASLRGGRGTVPGVLLGGFIMATLLNGLSLLAVPPEARFIARGTVLGLAAWLDVALSRGKTGGGAR
jgi:D-xylose transport system permease protein